MTGALRTADGAALAAFLERLLHFDRAAAVRLRAPAGGGVLAAFGRPPFEVLAVRSVRVAGVPAGGLDATVSAGELREGLDDDGRLPVPAEVAAASWAGMLPPRGGWTEVARPEIAALRARVGAGIAAFRDRAEALAPEQRTRARLDAAAAEVWDAAVVAELPLRAAHAAQAMGFLPGPRAGAETGTPSGTGRRGPAPDASAAAPGRTGAGGVPAAAAPPGDGGGPGTALERAAVLRSGPWWRLRSGYGEVAYRRPVGAGIGLTVG